MFVAGKIALDAFFFLAAEGRVGEDHVDTDALVNVSERETECVEGINLRSIEAVEKQVKMKAWATPFPRRFSSAAEAVSFSEVTILCLATPGDYFKWFQGEWEKPSEMVRGAGFEPATPTVSR